jgi:hypothetical protein
MTLRLVIPAPTRRHRRGAGDLRIDTLDEVETQAAASPERAQEP